MSGSNLIWHKRYKAGELSLVRECRTCANERERRNHLARLRNQELAAQIEGAGAAAPAPSLAA